MKQENKDENRLIKRDIIQKINTLTAKNKKLKEEIRILKNKVLQVENTPEFQSGGLRNQRKCEGLHHILEIINDKLTVKCSSNDFRDIYRIV